MILIIGTDEDNATLYFHNFLNERKVKHIFLNQKLLFNKRAVLFSDYLSLEGNKYFYNDFSGTLNRMSSIDYAHSSNQEKEDGQKIDAMLSYIMSYKLKNVLNLNRYSLSNDSKLLQLSFIKDVAKYIKIPESIVIKNLAIDKYLYKFSSHNKHVVKSLSSIRSIAKVFEENRNIFNLNISFEPVLFQQLLDGQNIRVHVINEYVFPVKIYSDSVDYRYENNILKFEPTTIPKEIEQDCINISKHLKLKFTGIDLLLSTNLDYYTFEVNPSPGYYYFEKNIDSKFISEKLLEVLQSE
jgi:hypothetical protein